MNFDDDDDDYDADNDPIVQEWEKRFEGMTPEQVDAYMAVEMEILLGLRPPRNMVN
jgi:hypothetical protein